MSGVRAVVSLSLAIAGFAACQKSSLQPGGPTGGINPFPDGGPGSSGAGGDHRRVRRRRSAASPVSAVRRIRRGIGGGGAPPDYGASACVTTSAQLPWTTVTGSAAPGWRWSSSSDGSAIAVLNRQPTQLDVRTYRRDGTPLGGRQFAADVQLLRYDGDHFLLIAHGVSGDFGGTDRAADADRGGNRSVHRPEHGDRAGPRRRGWAADTIVLLTTERFVNMTTGVAVPWTDDAGPRRGRPSPAGACTAPSRRETRSWSPAASGRRSA